MRPPPTPPCWPLYPEPERSRLEASYRKEHAEYCAEMDRDIKLDLYALGTGIIMMAAVIWLLN